MPTYGLPYMGSKNGIVKFIYKNLPSGKRLVDLFGGGGAITHYAILKNQDFNNKGVDMKNKIEKIFSRQYKRLETKLLSITDNNEILNNISKYIRYIEKDVLEVVKNNDNKEKKEEEQQ